MEFYTIHGCEAPWGDYGDTLLQGHAERDGKTGQLLLDRTGPYVPPISFPGLSGIVVTDELRSRLQASGLTGFSFQPVVVRRIVNLPWETWDRSAKEPKVYPKSGEPEDYILRRKHSPEIASKMPRLWELDVQTSAHVERVKDASALYGVNLFFLSETWNGNDLVRVPEVLYTYADAKAREWFESSVPELVSFRAAIIK